MEYGSDELMGSLSEEDEGVGEGRHNLSAYRRSRIADLHVELVELMILVKENDLALHINWKEEENV